MNPVVEGDRQRMLEDCWRECRHSFRDITLVDSENDRLIDISVCVYCMFEVP